MPGTRYDFDLDQRIVRILLDSKGLELRHNQLERELNSQRWYTDKVSSATLSSHLKILWGGEVLHRRVEKNGHTYYTSTERFRAVSDSERKYEPTEYIKNALSRFDTTRKRSFGKEVPTKDYILGNYRIGRKRKSK
jgi:DNA-binding HxlR family transcriptional regulator